MPDKNKLFLLADSTNIFPHSSMDQKHRKQLIDIGFQNVLFRDKKVTVKHCLASELLSDDPKTWFADTFKW